MLVPIGSDVRLPVRVVLPTWEPPLEASGVLRRLDAGDLAIEVPLPEVEPGTRILVDGGATRWLGRVAEVKDGLVHVRRESVRPTDERAAPRVVGELGLRYRRCDDDDLVERWVRDGFALPAPEAWPSPEPRMDFSLSGLRFRADHGDLHVGDRLLIELVVPVEPTAWRASAVVRRLVKGPAGSEVAVAFVDLPDDAQDALADWTLACGAD